MIQVRKIQPKDIDTILQNSEELSFDKSIMLDKLKDMMIVINGNKICGIGCGVAFEDKCLLNWIYVSKDYRRVRMGTALVKTILNNAELNGAKAAYMNGSCDQFANSLKFTKLEDNNEIEEISRLYMDKFNDNNQFNFYKTSLIDYFNPCCSK